MPGAGPSARPRWRARGTAPRTKWPPGRDRVAPGAQVRSDEAAAYAGMAEFAHEGVKHSGGEYVRGAAHTNGIESFRSLFKRGFYGTYHRMSVRHLGRYLTEFTGRCNARNCDTAERMRRMARGLVGRTLTYRQLVGKAAVAARARPSRSAAVLFTLGAKGAPDPESRAVTGVQPGQFLQAAGLAGEPPHGKPGSTGAPEAASLVRAPPNPLAGAIQIRTDLSVPTSVAHERPELDDDVPKQSSSSRIWRRPHSDI